MGQKGSSTEFRHWHKEFTKKWEHDRFPDDYHVEELQRKAADGLFAISSTGKVSLAAMLFKSNNGATLKFSEHGGRHQAAVSIAQELKRCIVFVKSEVGSLHVITAMSAVAGTAYIKAGLA